MKLLLANPIIKISIFLLFTANIFGNLQISVDDFAMSDVQFEGMYLEDFSLDDDSGGSSENESNKTDTFKGGFNTFHLVYYFDFYWAPIVMAPADPEVLKSQPFYYKISYPPEQNSSIHC